MAQLELYHHAGNLASTIPMMAQKEDLFPLMLDAARTAPYLMIALLAFSALHLSSVCPDQESYYRHQAMQLQTHALSLFHETRPEATGDNCMHMVFFCSLSSFHSLREIASTTTVMPSPLGLDIDRAAVRGHAGPYLAIPVAAKGRRVPGQEGVQAGGGGIPSTTSCCPTTTTVCSTARPRAGRRRTVLRAVIADAPSLSAEEKQHCQEAIDRIQWIIGIAVQENGKCHGSHSAHIVMSWPSLLSNEVLDLLFAKRPEVILVLAYYGVVLHWCRHLWVFSDVGSLLVKSIASYLGPDWTERMAWPRAAVSRTI
ncbi:unnamed protein product [Discula destructiva]